MGDRDNYEKNIERLKQLKKCINKKTGALLIGATAFFVLIVLYSI